ncbi:hypothetical protein HQ865_02650 [Mucilaginibacter mali]|uniref:Uncharacterized protein n=1 Tax=Mucilaginibacter mali TaxID=2740462 RepID=A0A7D4UKP7_9SPHI|nr:hypothetical protein [Mucilaginibacter mali]QKJ28701.1 hypothetical protein HQ865_02650 [Mucilaginibacter mali]
MHIPHVLLQSFRALVVIFTAFVVLFVYLYYHSILPKEKLLPIIGKITFIDKKYKEYPRRDFDKFRYIAISGYPKVFEVFLDDSARQQHFDKLRVGDEITVYLDRMIDLSFLGETNAEEGVDRDAGYIEKDSKLYYKVDGGAEPVALSAIGFLIVCIIGSYVLYKKGKLGY